MSDKVKIGIFTAKNISTSTGSTNTVVNLLENLDENKYEISIITIDGIVPMSMKLPVLELESGADFVPFSEVEKSKKVSNFYELENLSISKIKQICEFAIVAIYNNFGEDGKIIGLLDLAEIPYLSPSLKTSSLCFDKQLTKTLLNGNKILTPKGFEIQNKNFDVSNLINIIDKEIKFPVIIKTTSSGASRGVSVVDNQTDLQNAVQNAFLFSEECIVEECLVGQEFSVGIIGNYLNPTALSVVEIKSANRFFDFDAKYTPGKSEEVCPAEISAELTLEIQKIAILAYQTVKADSHARIDVIFSEGKLYILEINTFPGLTRNSIFPKELAAMNMTLSNFIDKNIEEKIHTNHNAKN